MRILSHSLKIKLSHSRTTIVLTLLILSGYVLSKNVCPINRTNVISESQLHWSHKNFHPVCGNVDLSVSQQHNNKKEMILALCATLLLASASATATCEVCLVDNPKLTCWSKGQTGYLKIFNISTVGNTFQSAVEFCASSGRTGLNGSQLAVLANEIDYYSAQQMMWKNLNGLSAFVGLNRTKPATVMNAWTWLDSTPFDMGSTFYSFQYLEPTIGSFAQLRYDGQLTDSAGYSTWAICKAPCKLFFVLVGRCLIH
jgi:hypothetical protein